MASFADATDEQLLSLRDNPISIVTVDIRGSKVRTGIEAEKFVRIDRREVYEARKRDAAASTTPTTRETIEAHQAAIRKE